MPELGRHLEHVETLVDQQAGKAATQVTRDGVVGQSYGDSGRLEDALTPVIPVVAGPLAEDQSSSRGRPQRRRNSATSRPSGASSRVWRCFTRPPFVAR